VQSSEEERKRFAEYRDRLLSVAEIIPLTSKILKEASGHEEDFDFSPQDALVYASVITHMRQIQPATSCFLNKNSKDFDSPDILAGLAALNCRLISKFDDGLSFIRARADMPERRGTVAPEGVGTVPPPARKISGFHTNDPIRAGFLTRLPALPCRARLTGAASLGCRSMGGGSRYAIK
jgi:hypothetical protein